ncbi:hypothetical protein Trydic_g14000 [Trypoxylus dichotomus]
MEFVPFGTNNMRILPADKGNTTVVLNTRDYKDKMQKLLDDPTYKPIAIDPTTYLEKTTGTKQLNNVPLSKQTKKSVIPRDKSSKCPKTIGPPTQALAQYLANQQKPYGEQMTSYVKNGLYFVDILHQQHVKSTDIIISFDVTSPFIQVPMNGTTSSETSTK